MWSRDEVEEEAGGGTLDEIIDNLIFGQRKHILRGTYLQSAKPTMSTWALLVLLFPIITAPT